MFYEFSNHFSWRRNIFGVKIRVCNVNFKKSIEHIPTSPPSTLSLCALLWWWCIRYFRLCSYRPLETLQFCLWPWNCSNGCIIINIGCMFAARKSVLLNSAAWTYYYYYYYWLDHSYTYSNYYSSYQRKSISEKLLVAQLLYRNRNFIRVIKSYPDKSILSHAPSYKVHFCVNSLAIPMSIEGSRLSFPIKILCLFISAPTSCMSRLSYACSRLPKHLL